MQISILNIPFFVVNSDQCLSLFVVFIVTYFLCLHHLIIAFLYLLIWQLPIHSSYFSSTFKTLICWYSHLIWRKSQCSLMLFIANDTQNFLSLDILDVDKIKYFANWDFMKLFVYLPMINYLIVFSFKSISLFYLKNLYIYQSCGFTSC